MSATKTFKALSLWQPHAAAIRLGLKPFETRSWATAFRGPLVICASKKVFSWKDYPQAYYNEVGRRLKTVDCPLYGLQYGIAECIVTVVDCVPTSALRGKIAKDWEFWGDFSDGDDDKGRFAFRLQDVQPLTRRVEVTGRQGFFSVEIPTDLCGAYA